MTTVFPPVTLMPGQRPAMDGAKGSSSSPLVIVVGSGKGGVGKSVLTILMGSIMAKSGRRVLLCDADYNLGNLHVLLGIRPAARLDALLEGQATVQDLVRPVSDGLWLLPGESGGESLQTMEALDRARLQHWLTSAFSAYDIVLVDSAAGIDGVVRTVTLGAQRLLVVTMPEPTALTDAYALMKIVHLRAPRVPIDVLVNRCREEAEGRAAYDKLATASERFLRRGIRYLGAVSEDLSVRLAVRDPAQCLEQLMASEAAQSLTSHILDRMELPASVRSLG